MDAITMVIDGSAIGNPGPGGWAALLRTEGGERMLAGASPELTTNNRMELVVLMIARKRRKMDRQDRDPVGCGS